MNTNRSESVGGGPPGPLGPSFSPSLPVVHVDTPLVNSTYLGHASGTKVWLKMETVQPTGSFKARGMGNIVRETLLEYPNDANLRFICPSGGNAGCGVAYAAYMYRQKCTICVPETTHPDMVVRLRSFGAVVIAAGKSIGEADAYVRSHIIHLAKEQGEHPIYCHPYNDEKVWRGNSTLGTEIVHQTSMRGFKPAAVVCAIGGGGLYNGLVHAFMEAGWDNVPIVGVETSGCAKLHEALTGTPVATGGTIAVSLATPTVTTESIAYAKGGYPTRSIVVSDGQAARACKQFALDHQTLVEPACGAAMAPVYMGEVTRMLGLSPEDNVVVVVCGGTNVSWPRIAEWSAKL